MNTIKEITKAVNDLIEEAINAPGRNNLHLYNKNLLLDAIEELEKFRTRNIFKKLEFLSLTFTIMEAVGVKGIYKIQSQDGKCFAIKSVWYAGEETPVPFKTFALAAEWCQDDYDKEVGKFLQNP